MVRRVHQKKRTVVNIKRTLLLQNQLIKRLSLPKWIYDIIRPVFDALADGELLLKCFYGEAHNPSETFNKIVWPS